MSYHVTNLGSMRGNVRPDINGYVHETAEEVKGGLWDAATEMTDELAEEIAEHNRQATAAAEEAIADWQAGN